MKILISSRGRIKFIEEFEESLFQPPKQCYEIWAAALGAATAATSIGLSASGALNPTQPNLASSSSTISNVNAALLPQQRRIEAKANLGQLKIGGINNDTQRTTLQNQIDSIQRQLTTATPAQKTRLQNQLDSYQSQLDAVPENTPGRSYEQFGGIQTQAAIAKQNAGKQLAIQQKYAPQFISEALKQEQLANPDSVAARDRESQLIQQQIENPPTNPLGAMLESQITPQVQAGKGLDDFDTNVLNNSVDQALKARGGSKVVGDFTSPLITGFAGDQRQLAGINAGQQFLSSGTTPEDVAYRQQQQNMANLSAEINGSTPTSEFSSLTGASRSANPTNNGQPLPTSPGNSLQTGGNAALSQYGNQMGQANNWLSGLSTAANLGGAVNQFIPH